MSASDPNPTRPASQPGTPHYQGTQPGTPPYPASAPAGTPPNQPLPGHYPPMPYWGGYPPYQALPPIQPPITPAPATGGGFKKGFGLGSGVGLGLGAALAIGMLISSLVLGLLVGATAAASAPDALRTIWGSPTAPNQIRAIYLTGTILAGSSDGSTLSGGSYGYEIADQIDALNASDAAGLLLVINTPGGSINGSKAIADAVARYRERTGKKVVAHVQGMSASGGMYAMSGADQIWADAGSLVGSIGVIFGPFERYRDVKGIDGGLLSGGIQTSGGIEMTYLTMGTDKDFGNPFRDMREEERQVIMDGISNVYDDFVDTVAKGRNLQPSFIKDTLGAHIFDPETAQKHGLIDEQLGVQEAYLKAAEVMGVDPDATRIVTPAQPSLLEQLLGAEARVPGHAPALNQGQQPSAAICGTSPRALVFHGQPASVCG